MPESEITNSLAKQEIVLDAVPQRDVRDRSASLLDGLIASTAPGKSTSPAPGNQTSLDEFFKEGNLGKKLKLWFGEAQIEREANASWSSVARKLQAAIARIDHLLNSQVNAIIHHPDYQKLESSWRGVEYLTRCVEAAGNTPIKVRVLNASWNELCRDFDRAIETDDSQLFRKVYEQELGTPGGIPYSVLLADYEIHPRPSREHPHDDMAMLKSLSKVAASSFCPVILNASPTMFSLESFDEMQSSIDFSKVHQDLSFLSWRQFRETEDSRFVGLVMPKILMRSRYPDLMERKDGFPFAESIASTEDQLWGGACYAIGETLIRSFAESRWLADIRGANRGSGGGGLVNGPAREEFYTDSAGVALKPLTDMMVGDSLEMQMVDLGFIPLCNCKDAGVATFYSTPSAQKPKAYHDLAATTNAKMSSMLNYMFCVSRFAHYIKVMGRDKIGSFTNPDDMQYELNDWIRRYVTADADADETIKSKYPLRDAEVQVVPTPGKPGAFEVIMRLSPHFQLEDMQASIQLRAELVRR